MSDPYSSNTVLLLHMNGSSGSTTFTDSSALPKTVTANGNAQISTAQSKWGGSSLLLDGSGDYLSIVSSFLDLSTLDWTIELWCYCQDQTASYPSLIGTQGGWSTGAFNLRFDSSGQSGKFSVHWYGKGDPYLASSSTYSFNQWRHVAVVRNGTSCKLYVDGTEVASNTLSAGDTLNLQTGGSTRIGWSWDGNNGYYNGYIDDLRITKGVARYTAGFSVPAAAFPDPDSISGVVLSNGLRRDLEFGGGYQIVGTAQRLGASSRKRIRLHDRRTGLLIREVWSATDGSFTFDYLKNAPQAYLVMELDDLANDPWLDPACADRVTPEIM